MTLWFFENLYRIADRASHRLSSRPVWSFSPICGEACSPATHTHNQKREDPGFRVLGLANLQTSAKVTRNKRFPTADPYNIHVYNKKKNLQSSAKGTRNEKVPTADPYAPLLMSVKRRGRTALLISMAASTPGNARQKTSKHSHICV